MLPQLRTATVVLALLTLLTGVAYPSLVTLIAQLTFPHQANGSILQIDGRAVGSGLLGQSFLRPDYFWGRLSATAPFPYNAARSSGSNLGPENPTLKEAVQQRIAALLISDPQNSQPIPIDLVTASASGLDPHISLAAAMYQVSRVAKARGMSEDSVRTLVYEFTERRQFGILGEPRVNVLKLNLALDGIK